MNMTFQIRANNGTYDILQRSVPDGFLDRQLSRYGITEDDIKKARRDLTETGEAIVKSSEWFDTMKQL